MNPKIEVVKLNIARKGHQVGTFSAQGWASMAGVR